MNFVFFMFIVLNLGINCNDTLDIKTKKDSIMMSIDEIYARDSSDYLEVIAINKERHYGILTPESNINIFSDSVFSLIQIIL